MKLRVNKYYGDYNKIGQIIFRLTDSNNIDISNGVELTGVFTDSLYHSPNYNELITNNWSITKKAGISVPVCQKQTWLDILIVPNNAVNILIDNSCTTFFSNGEFVNLYWYYLQSGEFFNDETVPFIQDLSAVSPSDIIIVEDDDDELNDFRLEISGNYLNVYLQNDITDYGGISSILLNIDGLTGSETVTFGEGRDNDGSYNSSGSTLYTQFQFNTTLKVTIDNSNIIIKQPAQDSNLFSVYILSGGNVEYAISRITGSDSIPLFIIDLSGIVSGGEVFEFNTTNSVITYVDYDKVHASYLDTDNLYTASYGDSATVLYEYYPSNKIQIHKLYKEIDLVLPAVDKFVSSSFAGIYSLTIIFSEDINYSEFTSEIETSYNNDYKNNSIAYLAGSESTEVYSNNNSYSIIYTGSGSIPEITNIILSDNIGNEYTLDITDDLSNNMIFINTDNSIIYNRGGPIVQYTDSQINIILPSANDIDNSNNIYYTGTNNIGLKDMDIYLNNDITSTDYLTLTSFPSGTTYSYDAENLLISITNSSDVALIAGTGENFTITSTSTNDISISNIIVNTDEDISYSIIADYYN